MEWNEGHPLRTDLAAAISQAGWVRFNVQGEIQATLRAVGGKLNAASNERIQSLKPQLKGIGRRNSLTQQHGLSPFPVHTDGAHLLRPPRYIILSCVSPGQQPAPTILLHFNDLRFDDREYERLNSALFLFKNGRRSFCSTIRSERRPFIRFDEGCMRPLDNDANGATALVTRSAQSAEPTQIDWRVGDVLIIDNWNVLHGRGLANDVSPDRHLLRMSIS